MNYERIVMKIMNFRRATRRILSSLILFCATCLVASLSASAANITIPPSSLSPGSQYRLAFVTGTFKFSTFTDIGEYNAFVDGVANGVGSQIAGLSTWKAIASTASVAAIDNTLTDAGSPSYPIYNLSGEEVAITNADLWDGTLLHPMNVTEAAGCSTGMQRLGPGLTARFSTP